MLVVADTTPIITLLKIGRLDLLLMDEARGRLIAKQLGIPLTGSVGLLAAAFKLHIITPQELKSYVEIIKNSGRFIAKNLLQGLLELAETQ